MYSFKVPDLDFLTNPPIYIFVRSLVRSFARSFVRLFVRACVRRTFVRYSMNPFIDIDVHENLVTFM